MNDKFLSNYDNFNVWFILYEMGVVRKEREFSFGFAVWKNVC